MQGREASLTSYQVVVSQRALLFGLFLLGVFRLLAVVRLLPGLLLSRGLRLLCFGLVVFRGLGTGRLGLALGDELQQVLALRVELGPDVVGQRVLGDR